MNAPHAKQDIEPRPHGRPKALRRRGAARVIAEHGAQSQAEADLVEHPDGWYWVAADGHQQFGPFASAALARADRDSASDEALSEAEGEREFERQLGVEPWGSADPGAPSESDALPPDER